MINAVLNITPFDIDNMVEQFIKDNNSNLRIMCSKHYANGDIAFASFKKEIVPVLTNACIQFVNANHLSVQLKPYLIAVILNFFKKENITKLQTQYVCPGCRYFKEDTILIYKHIFKCDICAAKLKTAQVQKDINFFSTFATHNRKGFRCPDCTRFIPRSTTNYTTVFCPYYDCCFVGEAQKLEEMRHPIIQSKINIVELDTTNDVAGIIKSDSQLELKEDFKLKLETLKEVTQSQINSLYYNGTDSTLMHKLCMYQAFMNLMNRCPEDMISYLVLLTHNGGMQHRLFQEYVSILENKIPFTFKKGGKMYRVTSLLDDSLHIFDGISIFDATVTDKNSIKNLTSEFYVGGRKGTYAKPYYIGKLLDIIDIEKSCSIIEDVKEYSFSKIKLNKTPIGTNVRVSHLRVPPHYQMGGMAYLNRIRKKIVDKVAIILK